MLENGCAVEEPASLYKLFLEQSILQLETFAAEACGTIPLWRALMLTCSLAAALCTASMCSRKLMRSVQIIWTM